MVLFYSQIRMFSTACQWVVSNYSQLLGALKKHPLLSASPLDVEPTSSTSTCPLVNELWVLKLVLRCWFSKA